MKPVDHQFRQLAFALVLLGLLAFCIAEGRPVLLAVVGALAVVSWFVTEGPRRAGLGRGTLNLGAAGAVVLLLAEASLSTAVRPVVLIGHFTMALQLVLLFTKKSRREYVQLAVLSPLQMIGASLLPGGVTLIYGLLLGGYCFLALLTALTFQLKSAGDLVHHRHRRAAIETGTPERPDPIGGAHHRLHLRTSAAAIGLCCGAVAAAAFLTLPRTQQDPFAAALVSTPPGTQHQAGFSNRIRLTEGSIGGGSPEPVLNVRLSQNGEPIGSADQAWLLRGAVMDKYDPKSATWSRSATFSKTDLVLEVPEHGVRLATDAMTTRNASITLRRDAIKNLFTVVSPDGPVAPTRLDAPGLKRIVFNPEDQQLSASDAIASVQRYRIDWRTARFTDLRTPYRERLIPLDKRPFRQRSDRDGNGDRRGAEETESNGENDDPDQPPPTLDWSVQTERVRSLAERVLLSRGLPIDYRDADAASRLAAAEALAQNLRRTYRYTLRNPRVRGADPVVGFLLSTRAGHCELFASGLAAMCRSVGLPARLATGYRASEFNRIGGYYVVRRSHAHAWAEVDLGPDAGWHVLDATPSAEVNRMSRVGEGWMAGARALYDHIEFKWIATVITYDEQTQKQLLGALGAVLSRGPDRWVADSARWVGRQAEQLAFDTVGRLVTLVILAVLILALVSLARLLVVRHRRMVALQLTALPRARRRTLARQLRFYIAMLETLERHGRVRPRWQSPFQFAKELAEADPMNFDPVLALTELFYEVRFGYRPLDGDRLARVRLHLRRLEQNLAATSRL